jgi:hypothetical protein
LSTSTADFNTIVMYAGHGEVAEPGDFTLHAARPEELFLEGGMPPGTYLKSATINGIDALRKGFHAADGLLEVVVGLDGPTVSGVVVDKDGKPWADAGVLLAADPLENAFAGREYLLGMTDQHGSYTLRGMAPGKYRILALPELKSEHLDPAYFRKRSSEAEAITLSASEQRTVRCVVKE